ncbi:UDP-N-acetyl-D-mannosamine dehydrogenase [Microbacterium sp. Mcb102]|uniref:UDP-N-acetyl-D-mannosamine dehydrogenase n=1 Tax=Microbacterium sp. Mcb102 TaxID=2926012 RepID=UPI0021C8A9D7|nr:UDP-N-acetyl-D-mannosamine dehydrogenase [Microbacterium sp. Mcb102]
MTNVCVIGLGYIGLPTAAVLASHGHKVVGVDVNQRAVDTINAGRIHIVEPELEEVVSSVVASGALTATSSPVPADVFILTVPTPLDGQKQADMTLVDRAFDDVAPFLKAGDLVVLESTSPPGTTLGLDRRLGEVRPDLAAGSVLFAHAPERVLPGKIMREIIENDRIIGGTTDEASRRAQALYGSFVTGDLLVTDSTTAEMVKLTENSFRDVNIAFANELSTVSDSFGIDVWEVIRLANRHPRVNIMQPGPGVGGHCIAVDPWFIVSAANGGAALIETARRVNDAKPKWVLERIHRAIESISAPKVLILGLAFKANVDDLRESPAVEITQALAESRPEIEFAVSEPHIHELPASLQKCSNLSLVEDLEKEFDAADVVVLLVDHDAYSTFGPRLQSGKAVIDTRGLSKNIAP